MTPAEDLVTAVARATGMELRAALRAVLTLHKVTVVAHITQAGKPVYECSACGFVRLGTSSCETQLAIASALRVPQAEKPQP